MGEKVVLASMGDDPDDSHRGSQDAAVSQVRRGTRKVGPVSLRLGRQYPAVNALPFKIVVNDRVPPDRVYALDPKAIPDLLEWLRLDGDEEQIVACHTEADAERIRRSPKLVAALTLK